MYLYHVNFPFLSSSRKGAEAGSVKQALQDVDGGIALGVCFGEHTRPRVL